MIQSAKELKPDILVQYHSDGKINELIPGLIETGVNILNLVQPECVDHHWVKDKFGDKLAFNGGLVFSPFCRLELLKRCTGMCVR